MLVKVENGVVVKYPASVEGLRREHSRTSFPVPMPRELLELYGLFPVTSDPMPTADPVVNNIRQRSVPELVNNQWRLGWDVTPKPEAEAAAAIRGIRDDLLRGTDWTGLQDVTLSEEMAAYRQALRDVPAQAGFPYNVTWPTKP